MKKFLIFIFCLIGFLAFPSSVLADISCVDDGATIAAGSTDELKITITTTNAVSGYRYMPRCLEGTDTDLSTVPCIVQSSTQVICYIKVSDFEKSSCANKVGLVSFGLKFNFFNQCKFKLQKADIDAALTAAGHTPPPGTGGIVPPPISVGCTSTDFGTPGVQTALGCIPTSPQDLVRWILKYAILMGGGIAFLLSAFGGLSIIFAGGNPEKINAGKEIISSALTGLLFIVFSVFLLRLIGFDILQLPGFSNP